LELRPDLHRQTVLTGRSADELTAGRPAVCAERPVTISIACVCASPEEGSVLKQLARERQGLVRGL
jgi:hypothetical protein